MPQPTTNTSFGMAESSQKWHRRSGRIYRTARPHAFMQNHREGDRSASLPWQRSGGKARHLLGLLEPFGAMALQDWAARRTPSPRPEAL
jgi:hypothetical protein